MYVVTDRPDCAPASTVALLASLGGCRKAVAVRRFKTHLLELVPVRHGVVLSLDADVLVARPLSTLAAFPLVGAFARAATSTSSCEVSRSIWGY